MAKKIEVEILKHHYGEASVFIDGSLFSRDANDNRLSITECFEIISQLSTSLKEAYIEGDSIFYLTTEQVKTFRNKLNI